MYKKYDLIKSKKRVDKKFLVHILLLLCSVSFAIAQQGLDANRRPLKWAQPVMDFNLANLFLVDKGVYRSSQPSAIHFQHFENYGINEVLNLRNFHKDNDLNTDPDLILYRVKMNANHIKTSQVIEALRIIKNREGSILIHCRHGSDRTGVVIAMYRIVFQGWTKEEAIDELKNGGTGFHPVFFNIPDYILDADIDKIKRALENK